MARIRSIRPELWDSQKVGSLSVLARLTFIGLISMADDDGRGRGDSRFLMARLHLYSSDVTVENLAAAMAALMSVDLVHFYTIEGAHYYELPGWKNHQKIDKPNKSLLPAYSPTVRRQFADSSPTVRRQFADSSPTVRMGNGVEGNGLDWKQTLGQPPSASDFSGHRLKIGGEFKGVYVTSLTVEVAKKALLTARPNKLDQAALKWWIESKDSESKGMSKRAEISHI